MNKLFTSVVPDYLVNESHDLNKSMTLPLYMDNPIPQVPDWFLVEQFFTNVFNKNPHLPYDGDPEQAAVDLFFTNERRCEMLNSRFSSLLEHPRMREILYRWRNRVQKIMGKFSSYDISGFEWSSGAIVGCPTGNTPLDRIATKGITRELLSFAQSRDLSDSWYILSDMSVGITHLEFVPKTAKTHRVIAIPLAINAGVQRSIGKYLYRRLTFFGIDTRTAPDWHVFLAKWASITGEYTTEDLSSASHLIYTELVRFLVAKDWYELLDACRDHSYTYDGKAFGFHHFMPNGNGYCFELETIIFKAMLDVCCNDTESYAYGDDLIFKSEYTQNVRSLIKNIGFISNVEKSFSSGFFRESCGGDFIHGHDIRPLYIKSSLQTSYEKTVAANAILRKYGHDAPYLLRRAWVVLVRAIPRTERCWGPAWMGDVVLHSRHHRRDRCNIRDSKYGRRTIKVFRPEPREVTNFGQVANQGLPASVVNQLCLHDTFKGWGRLRDSYQRVYEEKQKPKVNCLLFVIAGLMLRTKLLIVNKHGHLLKKTLVYVSQPKAGTSYDHVIVDTQYFEYPSMIDEQRPLSIFDALKNHPSCERISSPDYFEKCREQQNMLSCRFRELLEQKLLDSKRFMEQYPEMDVLPIDF